MKFAYMKRLNAIGAITIITWLGTVTPALAACSNAGNQNTFANPLQFCSLADFVAGVLKALVTISLPIISVFMVYSGFLFVKARGNSDEIGAAKSNFYYVIIGSILILGAWALAQMLAGTVTQIRGNL